MASVNIDHFTLQEMTAIESLKYVFMVPWFFENLKQYVTIKYNIFISMPQVFHLLKLVIKIYSK